MTARKLSICNDNFFFYIGLLLITFNTFPFMNYGMGASKALSILPFTLYLMSSIVKGSLFMNRTLIKDFFYIILLLAISFSISVTEFHDTTGSMAAVSMWMVYIIVFLCLATFMCSANENEIYTALHCVYTSFKISFWFGLAEVIFFYIADIEAISQFIQLFVRDDMYLSNGRLQFNFGEPGDAGRILVCLFIPLIYALHRMGYKFKLKDKAFIVSLFLMEAFFAASVTFFCLIAVFVCSLIIIKYWKKKKTRFFLIALFAITGVFVVYAVNSNEMYRFANNNNIRILKLFTNGYDAFKSDNSSGVRFGLWKISCDIFTSRPVFGTGWGNFGQCFPHFYMYLDEILANNEMTNKLGNLTQQTYSIISTAFAEGGLVGVLWLVTLIARLQWRSKYAMIFIPVFLFSLFQSMFIYEPATITQFFMLSDKKINNILNGSIDAT